jgi:hypothetical protein
VRFCILPMQRRANLRCCFAACHDSQAIEVYLDPQESRRGESSY